MLQKGTKAPYFEGTDENGNLVRLSDFAPAFHRQICAALPPHRRHQPHHPQGV